MSSEKKMFVADFDGTLARDDSSISKKTVDLFKKLGEIDVIRVIDTGRSLFSFKTVVNEDFPIDYLVFSSGIGIYDWKNKKILQKYSIGEKDTAEVYKYLADNNYDFMVQLPVPNNHFFHHFSSEYPNSDFRSRISYYENYGIAPIEKCPKTASQFVIILGEEFDSLIKISQKFPHLKIVKATSPIDRKSVWIEILPPKISKATGIEFIQNIYNTKLENIVTVGNDYYDLDMLNYSLPQNSYIVANAPDELLKMFNTVQSNEEDGVAELIQKLYF
ncbi:MAG: HAD family hydrolase [Bacteroidales bacterium]|nr:HAD family hydrolase [Bacteroidales bacterium]